MLDRGFHDVPQGCVAAVVTHLEMRSPSPVRNPVSPLPGLSLVHVAAPGTDWYKAVFTDIGGVDWLWFSRLALPDVELAAIITDPAVEIRALRDADGRDHGLLELDFRVPGACEIAFFGVARALQGQGAGRFLMQSALQRAWAAPINRFHVHTCTLDHPAALPFSIRSGVTPVARTVEIAPDPRLTGLLPPEAAPQVPVLA
jgi:GNAT superfamily N-acetyltransferase